MGNIASIDIGSHTARLLIAEPVDSPMLFRPIKREREYTRLADGFNKEGSFLLDSKSINRTVRVLEKFVSIIDQYQVDYISAVATGVVRQALNKQDLLDPVRDRLGIGVRVISGEEEARLTDAGVSGSLLISGNRRIIFDLGGGSTEFIFSPGKRQGFKSILLGVMILTQEFIAADPPTEPMLRELSKEIDRIIANGLFLMFREEKMLEGEKPVVIGTGGTVTTLAAMVNRIETRDITHEGLNQTILNLDQIRSIYEKIKKMNNAEKSRVIGLDNERANVILAGIMAVIKILEFLDTRELVVSLSDMLEGLIIDHLKEN